MTSFSLDKDSFKYVLNGVKQYGIRIGDPVMGKRLKPKQYLVIKNRETKEIYTAKITKVFHYQTLDQMLQSVDLKLIYPNYKNNSLSWLQHEGTQARLKRYGIYVFKFKHYVNK